MTAKMFKLIYYVFDTVKTLFRIFQGNQGVYFKMRVASFFFWGAGLAIDSLYYILYFKYSLGLEDELKKQALKGLKPKECLDIVEALSKERTKILFMIFANITDLILACQYMGA